MKKVFLALAATLFVTAAWAQTNMALPAGTALKVKLEKTLTTFSNKTGDAFSGRVTEAVMLDGKTHRAKAGALLHFPRRIPHAFRNVGAGTGKTLWTVIPGSGFEKFFGELAALPAGPPDLAKVATIFSKYGMEVLPPK